MLSNFRRSQLAVVLLTTLGVTACGGGGGSEKPNPPPPTNSAPTISGTPITTIDENQAYSFTPSASDAENDSLSFSVTNKPSWLNINSSTGELSGTPNYSHAGEYTDITISVSDGAKSTSLASFSISVNDVFNLSGLTSDSVSEEQAYSFTPTITGAGNEDTFSSDNLPSWLSLNPATGQLSGTPTTEDAGTYEVTINADNGFTAISHTITITVTDSQVAAPGDFIVNGKVIDGYISGANVFIDFNNDLNHDDNEPSDISSAIVGEEGSFSIVVSEADISKLVHANLVAELGTGAGINADDVSRDDDDFQALPIKLMGTSMLDVDTSLEQADVMITPFSHLVQQLVKDSAETSGVLLSDLNKSSLKIFLDQAKLAVTNEQQVDLAIAMSDFFADDVDVAIRDALAIKAKALIEELQLRNNDSDNDGVSDFEDAFPNNPDWQKDTDNDGLADEDPNELDIDGDGLTNADDPNPTVYHKFEFVKPAPRANFGEICVGDALNDELLCLNNGEWAKPTTFANKQFNFNADTITTSSIVAVGQTSCVLTNNKVYCFGGDVGLEFENKYGVGLPAYAINPSDIQGGSSSICFLDDVGVHCFDGAFSDGLMITEQPDNLDNITDMSVLADSVCVIADGDVVCWGGNQYNINADVNATTFNQPKKLYNTASIFCVEDTERFQCWGATERLIHEIDHQSSSITDVSFTGKNVCLTDETGAYCYGYSPSENVNNIAEKYTYGDIYDPTDATTVLLDLTFSQDGEGNVIPVELNPNSITPEVFNEELHTRELVDDPIEIPQLNSPASIVAVAHENQSACFVDNNVDGEFVQCNTTMFCKAELASESALVANPETFPVDAYVWNCDEHHYNMDVNSDHAITDLEMNTNTACAFTVSGAYCEARDGSFVGDVVVPTSN